MLSVIVITAILSIQLSTVTVHSGAVEKCLEDDHHKKFPSREEKRLAACFPWQNKSCCSAEITEDLKENGGKNIAHFDVDYCGGLSESCKAYLMSETCFYLCDPNLFKWQASPGLTSRVPICSDTCDKWFEACKNDKTYSENGLEDYILYHSVKGPIKPNRPCRTFAEIFKNGEGLCNKLYGRNYEYATSTNCMVFEFNGENPNDKVMATPPT